MNQSPQPIDLRLLLTGQNGLRALALALLAYCGWSMYGVAPKMASASGAPVGDVVAGLTPLVLAVLSWLFSRKFAIKPELITAVTAVIANPKDAVADLKLLLVVVGYIHEQWPEAPEAVKLLEEAAQKLGAAVVSEATNEATAVKVAQ